MLACSCLLLSIDHRHAWSDPTTENTIDPIGFSGYLIRTSTTSSMTYGKLSNGTRNERKNPKTCWLRLTVDTTSAVFDNGCVRYEYTTHMYNILLILYTNLLYRKRERKSERVKERERDTHIDNDDFTVSVWKGSWGILLRPAPQQQQPLQHQSQSIRAYSCFYNRNIGIFWNDDKTNHNERLFVTFLILFFPGLCLVRRHRKSSVRVQTIIQSHK